MALFVGVDPGRKGFVVAVDDHGKIVGAWPIPYVDGELDLDKLKRLFRALKAKGARLAVLERQQVFGVEGIVSAFTTGDGFGVLRMGLRCADIETLVLKPEGEDGWKAAIGVGVVSPKLPRLPKKPKGASKEQLRAWRAEVKALKAQRKKLNVQAKKDRKDNSVIRAQQLAPGYDFRVSERADNSSDGKAEAFLMAEVARRRAG